MDRRQQEIGVNTVSEAKKAAEVDKQVVRAGAEEMRESFALAAAIRREFIRQPSETRREGLRRRVFFSPLDAPFLL